MGKGDDAAKAETLNEESRSTRFSPLKAPDERHHPHVVELIASEIKVAPSEIVDFEMILYDTQKSCVGGLNEELLFSPRLDNLEMSFCSTLGLINSMNSSSSLDDEQSIRLISLFDHEEIGSNTAQGADSNFLPTIIRRLSVMPGFGENAEPDPDAYEQSLSKSFLISADSMYISKLMLPIWFQNRVARHVSGARGPFTPETSLVIPLPTSMKQC